MELFPIIILISVIIFNTINCIDNAKENLKNLNKCCLENEVVSLRNGKGCMAVPDDQPLDFSQIPIFTHGAKKTVKKVNDTFTIVPGKFHSDEGFRNNSAMSKIIRQKKTVFLTEDGSLYIEIPNIYERWIKVDHTNFCFDFLVKRSTGAKIHEFWIKWETRTNAKNDYFLTAAMLSSCGFLLLVLIVYAILSELRNLSGLILMAYVASLFLALLCLAIIRIKTPNIKAEGCLVLTLVIYYFFLASFCWMNVMSYDIWCTFSGYVMSRPIHRLGKPFKYMMYSLYAWGLPLALTIMLNWIDKTDLTDTAPWFVKPNLSNACFIEGGEKFIYLYIPMLILICANWLLFLMTAFNIWRLSRGTSVLDSAASGTPAAHRSHKQRFLVYLKLTILMGLNWILEVVDFLAPGCELWHIPEIYNVLIGVFIFLIFVCKRNIGRKLHQLVLKCFRKQSKTQWDPAVINLTRSNSSDNSLEMQPLQVCSHPRGYVINNF